MKLFSARVLTEQGWQQNQLLTIEQGVIVSIEPGAATSADQAVGTVIPGMVNCHSHAFQRAFAGFSEYASQDQDSFWSWRKIMYQFLAKLTADDAELIAEQLYIEMLKAGYTRVAEFHYLHHNLNGEHYRQPDMAKAIFSAAATAGIGLTMLPVLYRYSGFGQQPPTQGQQRFIHSLEQFNQLVSDCFTLTQQYNNTNLGIAPHSLRAVDKTSLQTAVEHVRTLDDKAPIHIHIAEQQKEVDDCIAHYGQRPVEWLLANAEIDQHWCLIHATHINPQERRGIAASGAVAGICPTTEANLGDGIFPTQEFIAENGCFAIGSDSHISVNPVEELRWLEYAQRLVKQQRAVLATEHQPSVGRFLWQAAALGGAQSCAANTGEIKVGKQADLLVLDDAKLNLFAASDQYALDSLIFASQNNLVKDVMVNGQWVVENGQHISEQLTLGETDLASNNSTAERFAQLLARLAKG